MGIYFNPKNRSFSKDRNYEIYVDKTGLLSFLNKAIDTPKTVSYTHLNQREKIPGCFVWI